MITSNQLKNIARACGINPYYQEKEYLQHVFLHSLYRENADLIFKGGTCLRIAYSYPRYSEDLDYNTELSAAEVKKTVASALKGFDLLGIKHEYVKEESFENGYSAKIRFEGPLYTGKTGSANTIQLDIGRRDELLVKPAWVQASTPYPDIPRYLILAMDQKEILAEKIRALKMRGAPRDLFDVWSMIAAGNTPDEELIGKKIEGMKAEADICTKKEYERDLGNLLTNHPTYEQIMKDLEEILK